MDKQDLAKNQRSKGAAESREWCNGPAVNEQMAVEIVLPTVAVLAEAADVTCGGSKNWPEA